MRKADREFNRTLKATVRTTKPKMVNKPRQRVWWRPQHTIAVLLVLAVLVAGGGWYYQWLDGRSVTQGLSDLLEKSEKAHPGDAKTGTLDEPIKAYDNCIAMRQDYPLGIKRSENRDLYEKNLALDIDHDEQVCEA